MPLPERNSTFIIDCRFEEDGAHAAQRQILFALRQHRGANSLPPMRFRDIQCDDVREGRIFLGQNKPGNSRAIRRNNAIRARNCQKIVQRSLRIGNSSREAGLIQPVQSSKVVRLIGSKHNRHPAILRSSPQKSRGTISCPYNSDSAVDTTLFYSFTVTVLTSV
jgi:hypothetical protein